MSFEIDVSDLVSGDALEVSPHAGSRIITELLAKGYTFYLAGNAIVIDTVPDADPAPAAADAVVPDPDPVPTPEPEPAPEPEIPEPVETDQADPPLADVAAEEAVIEESPEPKRRPRAKKTSAESVED